MTQKQNRYADIIEHIFLEKFKRGNKEVSFERDDIIRVAQKKRSKSPRIWVTSFIRFATECNSLSPF